MNINARSLCWIRVCNVVVASLLAAQTFAGEPVRNKVTYTAIDQEASTVITALSTISGERFHADVALLAAGINRTQVSLALVDAGPDSCRQAMAFALDCWWARDTDNAVSLSTSVQLPQGKVEVRVLTSTLRRDQMILGLVNRLMAPWIGGTAGLSYMPSEGQWTATLDPDGHRRLVELLSLYERPLAQASSRVGDPSAPDFRRLTSRDLSAHSWPTLVEKLAQVMQAPVALSQRLRLRNFPTGGVNYPRQSLSALTDNLRSLGIAAFWCQGVLCLGEQSLVKEWVEREHPAQRRRLAIIPLAHLLNNLVDGELVVETMRQKIVPRAWDLPGCGIELIPSTGSLMVAGDADTHQAVLDAIGILDTLGIELGLQTISGGGR